MNRHRSFVSKFKNHGSPSNSQTTSWEKQVARILHLVKFASVTSESSEATVSTVSSKVSSLMTVDLWVNGVSEFLNYSVESVVLVSGVFDNSGGAIGFDEGVLSLDYVSVSDFVLLFNVSGVGIVNSVVETVFWVSLKRNSKLSKRTKVFFNCFSRIAYVMVVVSTVFTTVSTSDSVNSTVVSVATSESASVAASVSAQGDEISVSVRGSSTVETGFGDRDQQESGNSKLFNQIFSIIM